MSLSRRLGAEFIGAFWLVWETRRQHRAAASAQHQPECSDELSTKPP